MFCTISQSNAKQSAQMSTPKMAYAPGERETISYLSTRSRPFRPDVVAVLVGKWKIARVEFAYGHCGWPLVSGGSKGTMTFRLNSHNLIASAAHTHNAVPCRACVRVCVLVCATTTYRHSLCGKSDVRCTPFTK